MLHRRQGRSAFTLVELLVVIGVIAILISILLPALALARRRAQDVICESNFRQFGMAIQIYCNNSNGFLPQKGPSGAPGDRFQHPPGSNPFYDDDSLWFNALPRLIDQKSYYEMLLDSFTSKGTITPPNWQNNKSIFTCPLMGAPGSAPGSADTPHNDYYWLWGKDSTNTITGSTGLSVAGQFPFDMVYVWNSKLQSATNRNEVPNLKIDNCQPASAVVMMTEKLANWNEYLDKDVQNWNDDNPSFYKNPGKISSLGYLSNVAQPKADWTRFTTRHHGGGFLLFADGHVQWYGWPGVQYHGTQLTNGYNANSSDANQYGEIQWSAVGPVNSSSLGG